MLINVLTMYESPNGSDCAKEILDLNIKTIDVESSQHASSDDASAAGGGDGKLTDDQLHDAEQQGAPKAVLQSSVFAPLASEKTLPSTCDFSHKAVTCLIEAVQCRMSQYMKGERSQFFQVIQEEIAKKGHVYPVEKIRRKWNNLIVTYKRAKDRSLDKGNAKTTWEFFDLMDATVGATIGAEIIIQRKKSKNTLSLSPAVPVPLGKITKKSSQPTIIIHSNGTITPVSQVATSAQGNVFRTDGSATSITTVPGTTVASGTNVSELMPLLLIKGGVVTAKVQPAAASPAVSTPSSLCPVNARSPSPALGQTEREDAKPPRYINIKGPTGIIRARLTNDPVNPQSLTGLSSLPLTSPAVSSSPPASFAPAALSKMDGQFQMGGEEELRLQAELLRADRAARRRAEARAKRRQRREVRMVESLGRIATAMDLLSSKQDTVIALLQRIADRK